MAYTLRYIAFGGFFKNKPETQKRNWEISRGLANKQPKDVKQQAIAHSPMEGLEHYPLNADAVSTFTKPPLARPHGSILWRLSSNKLIDSLLAVRSPASPIARQSQLLLYEQRNFDSWA
jgi:hypothetical protein